ncbi:porin [uncultured Shewanella sp.]|uniref:porin n=1 Tax=uncultured Shewanella sp. TaxID=173975 RepID=UPI0026047BCC|nr:porin [uncultured Shewanella sp.]
MLINLFTLPIFTLSANAEESHIFGNLSISPEYMETVTAKMNISIYGYLGIRGERPINKALNLFYNISYEMESGKDNENDFSPKDQYIGLQGNLGVIALGRDKTLLKRSEGNVDLFNYLSADIKFLFKGQDRLPQTATYVTPTWQGSNVGISYLTNANEEQYGMNGYSIAARYGDTLLNDSALYTAIAYDHNVKGYNIFRATFQSQFNQLILGGMYQRQEQVYSLGIAVSEPINTGYMLSLIYPLNSVNIKGQFQIMENTGRSAAIGLEYSLSNAIDLLLYYVNRCYDEQINDPIDSTEEKYLGININYLF